MSKAWGRLASPLVTNMEVEYILTALAWRAKKRTQGEMNTLKNNKLSIEGQNIIQLLR